MNLDYQFKAVMNKIIRLGKETEGRTETNRIRMLGGTTLTYDCSDGKMSAFTLRANNPQLAIAETMAFLMGARTVQELITAHPSLKLWQDWAADDGSLGGVYGDAFCPQYKKILYGLKNNPLSTHHRMTTLIPDKFPIPGNTYDENVLEGLFSLMPCLHSYHFLSDGEWLTIHATQASADTPVGVFPHNCYQVQFMLLLTAYLTGLKPLKAKHHIHDAHIYTNQIEEVEKMIGLDSMNQAINVSFNNFRAINLKLEWIPQIGTWIETDRFKTHPPIKMKVDS